MRSPIFYILLVVLVILDGWLLAHANLIGQAGVFFFEYEAIETFPKAVGTVALFVTGVLLIVLLTRLLSQPIAVGILMALLAASAYYLFQSFTQYNSGIYKLTGAGFRAGAVLLPGLAVLLFGFGFLNAIQSKPARR